jgi:hypothetical protein
MATYYWYGGTGFWSDAAHWSKVDGGSGSFLHSSAVYAEVPVALTLPTATTPFTLEVWVRPTLQLNGGGIAANRFQSGNAVPFALAGTTSLGGTSGSNLSFGFYNGSSWAGIQSSTSLTLGVWSHIAAVYDGTTASLYLNGTRIGTYTGNWTSAATVTPFRIGSRWDSVAGDPYFTGNLTNFRFVSGYALYSGASITVPTTELAAVTGTQILLKTKSNATFLTDSSTNNYAVSAINGLSWVTTSPFTAVSQPTTGDSVVFNANSSPSAYSVTLNSNVSVADISFAGPASGNLTIADTGQTISFSSSLSSTATGVVSAQTGGYIVTTPAQGNASLSLNGNTTFSNTSLTLNCGNGAGTSGTYNYPADFSLGALTFNGSVGYFNGSLWTNSTGANAVSSKGPGGSFTVYAQLATGLYGTSTISMTSGWINTGGANFQASIYANPPLYTNTSALTVTATSASLQAGTLYVVSDSTVGNVTIGDGALYMNGRTLTCNNLTINNATGGQFNGLTMQYSTINVGGTYSVPSYMNNSSISISNTGIPAWGPTSYTSKISNIYIRTSQVGQPNLYDIVFVFNNFSDGAAFQTLYNTGNNPYANTITGTMRNNVGTGLFTGAGSVGSWVDFTLPKGFTNTMQQGSSNEWWTPFTYFPNTSFGLVVSNSGSTTPSVTVAGGGSSVINMTGNASSFSEFSGLIYPTVVFKSTAAAQVPTTSKSIVGDCFITNLTIEGPSTAGYSMVRIPNAVTVTNLVINSQATYNNRVLIVGGTSTSSDADSSYQWGTITFNTSSTMSAYDTDFMDIKLSGATISTLTTSRIGDGGRNSSFNNFTFASPQTYYWSTAAGGTIDGTNTWATTDGGVASSGRYPLIQDTIKFTNNGLNSGATVTLTGNFPLGNVDFSSRTLPLTLQMSLLNNSVAVYFFGNLTLSSSMTMQQVYAGGYLTFLSNNTITSNGVVFNTPVRIYTPKTVTVSGNLNISSGFISASQPSISLIKGTLDISNVTLYCGYFDSGTTPAGYETSGRALLTNSSSAVQIYGLYFGKAWAVQNGQFRTPGTTPAVYLVGTQTQTRVTHSYSSSDPTNSGSGTFKEIDFYITGAVSTPYVEGVFGNFEYVTSSGSGSTSSSNSIWIKKSIKVMNTANVGGYFYTIPDDGTTCTVIANWIYGEGATGTTGATFSWNYLNKTYGAGTGTTRIPGPARLTGGRTELQSGTLDISNTTNVTFNGLVSVSAIPKTWNFNGAKVILGGSGPIWFTGGGTNNTFLYNSDTIMTSAYVSPTLIADSVTTFPPLYFTNPAAQISMSTAKISTLGLLPGQTLTLSAGSTLTVSKLVAEGTLATPINIKSSSTTKAYIGHNGGSLVVTGVAFTDMATSGNAEFLAFLSPAATRTTGWVVKITKRPLGTGYLIFC